MLSSLFLLGVDQFSGDFQELMFWYSPMTLPLVSEFLIELWMVFWSRLLSCQFFAQTSYWPFPGLHAIFPSKSWTWLSRALIQVISLLISNCCCLSCSSNDVLFLLGSVGKLEIWSTWDACWTGVADAVEGVFTEVASSVDPVKFLLVEVAAGVRLKFLFLFCLEDVMFRFYLLK